MREFLFCGKRERENSRFVKNQNWRIFFFYPRILLLWKTRIQEFFFIFFLSETSRFVENQNWRIFFFFFFIREFSYCGKRERENSRFVKNPNWRLFFFYPRILVLWKTRIGEFFFFCFFYPRGLVLWKTRIGEFFFFFIGEFSFCGKREREKPELEIFFFFIREFSHCGKPESKNFFFFF